MTHLEHLQHLSTQMTRAIEREQHAINIGASETDAGRGNAKGYIAATKHWQKELDQLILKERAAQRHRRGEQRRESEAWGALEGAKS